MKKILTLLLFCVFSILNTNLTFSQCTPSNCLASLPAYGGICDTVLNNGRVGTAYSDFESFHTTTACFDAGIISPPDAGTNVRIVRVDNFTFSGLPGGLTAATNQAVYNTPSNGCISISGNPTTAGVFAVTANFLADINAYPFGCSSFPIARNDNAASYALDLIILPKPNFTIPRTTFCTNDNAVTLSLATGSTTGGTFVGPGVTGTSFNPTTAGVGTHIIKYRVSAQQGAAIAPATDSFSITVTVSDGVSLSTSSSNVTCATGGIASASAIGGAAPYTYAWSNGGSTAVINNLNAGTYTVTASNASGCTATNSVTVTSSVVTLTTNTPVTTNSSCGGATGSASISATNGTSPFTYLWSNGGTTQTINNVASGSYSVTITDASSCQGIVSGIVVNNPNSPSANISSSSNILCNGAANGSATVVASGGTVTSGYTYNWSNGGNTATLNNLGAGVYTVTVIDNASCLDVASVTISEPSAITISATRANVFCFGAATGSVSVTVNGGAGNYTYLWNNGNSTSSLSNIIAGSYDLTVTDANNCVITYNVSIAGPQVPFTGTLSSTNVLCNGAGNGTASYTISGGTSPYNYSWSNGSVDAAQNQLITGTYTVTVTDALGCLLTPAAITISEPAALSVSLNSTDASAFGGSDGTASSTVSGGTAPYTYSWSNGANTQNINNLTAGTYNVTVTDANGCIYADVVTVDQPSSISQMELTNISVYPNPGDKVLNIEMSALNANEVNIQIISIDAKILKSENFNNNFGLIQIETADLSSGMYFIHIQTERGSTRLKWVKK